MYLVAGTVGGILANSTDERLLVRRPNAARQPMSDVKVTVGGAIEDEAALAKSLGRDYSNVHADVQALTSAGLLDVVDGQLRAEYDAIDTTIAI